MEDPVFVGDPWAGKVLEMITPIRKVDVGTQCWSSFDTVDEVAGLDASTVGCTYPAAYPELVDEKAFRQYIEEVKSSCIWEPLGESSREPDDHPVIRVEEPFVTVMPNADSSIIPVEVPAGAHGLIVTMAKDYDMYIFFPDLINNYNCHPWRWVSERECKKLCMGSRATTAVSTDSVHVAGGLVAGDPVKPPRPSKRELQKERQLARRKAKAMM